MYTDSDAATDIISKYAVYSFGGSSIASILKKLYSNQYKKNKRQLINYTKALTTININSYAIFCTVVHVASILALMYCIFIF